MILNQLRMPCSTAPSTRQVSTTRSEVHACALAAADVPERLGAVGDAALVSVLMPLIEAFCPQGGTVLDPFCGSGSTLVAARSTGRRRVGIELDSGHHSTCRRRLTASAGRP